MRNNQPDMVWTKVLSTSEKDALKLYFATHPYKREMADYKIKKKEFFAKEAKSDELRISIDELVQMLTDSYNVGSISGRKDDDNQSYKIINSYLANY